MKKLIFKGIGYGGDGGIQTVMKPMAIDLKGTMVIEIEPAALSNAFKKIIPNLYESKFN